MASLLPLALLHPLDEDDLTRRKSPVGLRRDESHAAQPLARIRSQLQRDVLSVSRAWVFEDNERGGRFS